MNRLSLNDDDKKVRDWLKDEVQALGCQYSVDEMGNQFAVMAGTTDKVPPIAMGSHLDTQPAGGRYDGILGILSGLETLKAIKRTGHKTFA